MMYSVGLDLGGTHLKTAVLDHEACIIRALTSQPLPPFRSGLREGWRELDPTSLLESVGEAISRVVREEPRCNRLFLCGQMHGLVLVDSQGHVQHGAITWQDTRTLAGPAPAFDILQSTLSPDDRKALGQEVAPGHPLSLLVWMKARGVLGPDLIPLSIPDFIAFKLAGGKPRCDPTHAAASGAFHLELGTWHWDLLRRLELDHLSWPDVVPSGAALGPCIDFPFVVHAPLGDQQAALAGSLLSPGELSLNLGTGSQVSQLSQTAAPNGVKVRPFLGGSHLHTLTHLPSGRALQVLFNLLTELAPPSLDSNQLWGIIAAKASEASDAPEVDLSFFPCSTGEMGSIRSIREEHFGAGELFRGAFESMARNYEVALRILVPVGDPPPLVFSGGLSHRLSLLRDLVANRLGCSYRLSPCPEETLLGLLALALASEAGYPVALEHMRNLESKGHRWVG